MDETQTSGAPSDPAAAATSETQPSEADVQINNAPEATQAVEEKDTAEVKAEETAEDKLYAGKYKSVEELEKAYASASSEASKISQEKAELTRILNESFTLDAPQEQTAEVADEVYRESDPLAEKVERLDKLTAVQNFIFSHPEANPKLMQEILANDTVMKNVQGYEAKLEYAYLKSQNMVTTKTIAEAKKTASSETQAKFVEKQAAQVESARKADDSGDNSLLERATGNYTRDERDAARRELIKKQLINL